MSRRANLFRLGLSLVTTITLVFAVNMIGSTLPSAPSPMTSPKRIETICVAEIDNLINNNLKRLNISPNTNKQLERKIEAYIVQDNKQGLKKETCKKIAKNIVAHSKFPIITTSIIFLESSYNKQAINKHSGATGLGQIHPIHKEELKQAGIISSFDDLKKIEPNIKAIDFVLQQKLKITKGNMTKALTLYSGDAYNYSKKIQSKVVIIKEFLNTI